MFYMQGCREVAMSVGEGGSMRGDTCVLHARVSGGGKVSWGGREYERG